MARNENSIIAGVAILGLVAAWYWSKRQTTLLQTIALQQQGTIGQPGNPQNTNAPGAAPLSSAPIVSGDGPDLEITTPLFTAPDVQPSVDPSVFADVLGS